MLALAFLLAGKLVNIFVPLLYKHAVDALAPSNAAIAVPVALIIAYGLARVMSQGFNELRNAVFAKVGQRAVRRLALTAFRHVHALSLRFHLERRTGGLSRAIERGTAGIDFLLSFMLFNVVPTLFEILLVCGILWRLFNWTFAAVTLATIVLYIGFTFSITDWRVRFRREMNDRNTEANTKAVDGMLNFETVKYFANEEHEAQRYDAALRAYERAAVRSETTLTLLNLGQGTIIATGLVAIMMLAARGVAAAEMTVGDFVLVNAYLIQLYTPLNFLGMVYRNIKQSLTDLEQMTALLAVKPEIEDRPGAPALIVGRGAVAFRRVDFRYDSARPILSDVDFRVPPGCEDRDRRAERRRQIDDRPPAVPLLRCRCRRDRDRRPGHSRRSPSTACAARSAWCRRTPCCSTTRSTTTSPMAAPGAAAPKSRRPPATPTSTISLRGCPTVTRRWSASAASSFPAARSSASRSPG